jgi:hypothetical protein
MWIDLWGCRPPLHFTNKSAHLVVIVFVNLLDYSLITQHLMHQLINNVTLLRLTEFFLPMRRNTCCAPPSDCTDTSALTWQVELSENCVSIWTLQRYFILCPFILTVRGITWLAPKGDQFNLQPITLLRSGKSPGITDHADITLITALLTLGFPDAIWCNPGASLSAWV